MAIYTCIEHHSQYPPSTNGITYSITLLQVVEHYERNQSYSPPFYEMVQRHRTHQSYSLHTTYWLFYSSTITSLHIKREIKQLKHTQCNNVQRHDISHVSYAFNTSYNIKHHLI